MKQASVAGRASLMAIALSATVLVLMLYRGLAEPEAGETLSLDMVGWAILVSALGCLVVSIVLAVFVRFHHAPVAAQEAGPAGEASEPVPGADEGAEVSPIPDLSGLPEDERRLYEIVESAGGEILQMKLVSSGEFSKSKVTRLLDKLERRGLIKRERRGMTNLVRLTR